MDPGSLWLTEGGLETWLVHREGIALPHFAAFDLVRRPGGRALLERHYRSFAELGAREGVGVILETATWRASADWGARLGYDARQLEALHHELVELLLGVRAAFEPSPVPILVAGCVGPRSVAYAPRVRMTVGEAADYHGAQLATFTATSVDLVVASLPVPLVLSFTVETDGPLPSGQRVGEAIEQVDEATGGRVAYFMINCAHPSHRRPRGLVRRLACTLAHLVRRRRLLRHRPSPGRAHRARLASLSSAGPGPGRARVRAPQGPPTS
jgi:S-methylmethionine-dependent homocysteine/selenocysteine methylase